MASQVALNVLSLNGRPIKSKTGRVTVLDFIRNSGADILCLQECGISDSLGDQDWSSGQHVRSRSALNWNDGIGILLGNKKLKIEATQWWKLGGVLWQL